MMSGAERKGEAQRRCVTRAGVHGQKQRVEGCRPELLFRKANLGVRRGLFASVLVADIVLVAVAVAVAVLVLVGMSL